MSGMIQEFVDRFMVRKAQLAEDLRAKEVYVSYEELVKLVVTSISEVSDYRGPDPERVHVIDDGDYQGTALFIIGAKGYQPSTYWSVYVGYGSCSGCDSLQSLQDEWRYGDKDEATRQIMLMALHIVQSIRVVGDPE